MKPSFARAAVGTVAASMLPAPALAAETPPAPLGVGSLVQMLIGLGVVLAMLLDGAVFVRRLGRIPGLSNQAIKTIAAASVGTRERVVLLEVADQWVLIGVAPGQVRSLATLPKGQLTDLPAPGLMNPGFAQVLQRFKERRDAR